jgi:hypothetical protein
MEKTMAPDADRLLAMPQAELDACLDFRSAAGA